MNTRRTTAPRDPALAELCQQLAQTERPEDLWPADSLSQCAAQGVFAWHTPRSLGGLQWSAVDLVEANLHLAASCLTTTFILTQLTGALRRVIASQNEWLKQEILPKLVDGQSLATLGISHLTTSRQHLGKPVLAARPTDDGFVLDGISPWVTGAGHVDYLVTGATMADGQQLLVLAPTDLPGIEVQPPQRLVALTGSQTGAVRFVATPVPSRWVLDGPAAGLMQGGAAGTGGLQTSTLALGLASAALQWVADESQRRSDLIQPLEQLQAEWQTLRTLLRSAATGEECHVSNVELRTRSNSLVLRATHAALSAAKGSGYVEGHPVGRWCREALFFLVWSCPQPVVDANLCEFAGTQG